MHTHLYLLRATVGDDTLTKTCTYSTVQLQLPALDAAASQPLSLHALSVQQLQGLLLLVTHTSSLCSPSHVPVAVIAALQDALGPRVPWHGWKLSTVGGTVACTHHQAHTSGVPGVTVEAQSQQPL